jgi:DNA replication and repair protein RecF
VHVGTQGFSPRTRTDADLIRFGAAAGRIVVSGEHAATAVEIDVRLRLGEAKRARLNGAPLAAAEQLRGRAATLVFTPDRLAVVKGGPGVRRAYFDRALGRAWPARTSLPADYAATVSQRNAALRRVAAGVSSRDALAPWSERLAELGARLVAARRELTEDLQPRFRAAAAELGLEGATLRYDAHAPTTAALEQRLEHDLERGSTGLGPHLDDIAIASGDRELRGFGSQGEQRLAVLSLLLAEAEFLTERTGIAPLLLLDDVLSELDDRRRHLLAGRVAGRGQALLTTTSAGALPAQPDELVEVEPGAARAR